MTENGNRSGSAGPSAQTQFSLAEHAHHEAPYGGPAALECLGLAKRFGDVEAIESLDLSVSQGQVLALLGPSGCGKTTTLRLIAGFDEPDAGTITIGRRTVFRPGYAVAPEKRKVGMVFQEGALFPHLTVEQNIVYGLARGLGRKDRLQEILELVGLDTLRNRMPHELSGGQQQRVALARALAPRPELLLLDEPFSNLDPGLRQQVRRDTLEILRASNATAIFVTHDQEEALFMGDVLAIMNHGRIEQMGSPEAVFHAPATRFVAQFMGLADFIPAWRDGEQLVTEVGAVAWPATPFQIEGTYGSTGSHVAVMVRPDCLHCYPSDQGQGKITAREFQGAFYLYRVSLPSGTSVRCLLPHTAEFALGTTVAVALRQGHSLRPFVDDLAVSA